MTRSREDLLASRSRLITTVACIVGLMVGNFVWWSIEHHALQLILALVLVPVLVADLVAIRLVGKRLKKLAEVP